jgi:hypothetical protein
VIFVAGSLDWPAALSRPDRMDRHIRAATRNLLDRITRPRP